MKYSDLALNILAAKECGIIKTNAQFRKEFPDRKTFEKRVSNNKDIKEMRQKLLTEFGSLDDLEGFVCIYDDEFPIINSKVKNNSEKPYLFFYRGDITLLRDLNKNVAVIGLLDPDDKIVKRESEIVRKLVKNDILIVSGLAAGCDTVAHQICLDSGGKTIAVLPTPMNKIYPAVNKTLAEEIVEKGGLLISEYYKDAASRREAISRLIERDRLQAMFAKAIILTASYRKGEGDSGSRHAMEAARRYEIERYVMYNQKTDESNLRFGLNKDLLDSKYRRKVSVLHNSSIGYINSLINMDLVKESDSNDNNQLSLL